MDLNEQATDALNALLDAEGIVPIAATADERRIARMMWLGGYKAGMEAVAGIAQASFERLQAELS